MEDSSDNLEDVDVIYLDESESTIMDGMIETMTYNEEFEQKVEEVQDCSKLTFIKHTKSVFCSDLGNDGQLAVTGGEDDCAYVWFTHNGEIKFECTGHKDSIIFVGFNYSKQLLATGDMSGMIQVWDINNEKLVWCYEGDDMEWITWHPLTNILLAGMNSGEVFIWQVPQGNCKILTSHGSPCSCGKLLPDGKHLLTGYEDGKVKLWDIKLVEVKWQNLDEKKSITSIEVNSDGTLCSLAPSSNLLKVSDGKYVGTFLMQHEVDIESHSFNNELNLLVTGALNGQICVWDLKTQLIRHQAKLDDGITILKLGIDGKALIGSINGNIYVCDIRTGQLCKILTGHKASILSICVSQTNAFVLSTSDDETAKIFCISDQ